MNFASHYITDEKNTKISIILPINEYEELLEDLSDLAAIATRRDEPELSHDTVIAGLKHDGLL